MIFILLNIILPFVGTLVLFAGIVTFFEIRDLLKDRKLLNDDLKLKFQSIFVNKKTNFRLEGKNKEEIHFETARGDLYRHVEYFVFYPLSKIKTIFNLSGIFFPYKICSHGTTILVPFWEDNFIKVIKLKRKRLLKPKKRIG